jgi:hypothetical protein
MPPDLIPPPREPPLMPELGLLEGLDIPLGREGLEGLLADGLLGLLDGRFTPLGLDELPGLFAELFGRVPGLPR